MQRNRSNRPYNSWSGMIQRCLNPNRPRYKDYGGRGIEVCKEWVHSFDNFLRDMGECPPGYVLDRIDNNGDYHVGNCRWASYTESGLNKGKYKNNSSGRKGVSRNKGKWMAYGNVAGVRDQLYFGDSFEDACKARSAWEAKWL